MQKLRTGGELSGKNLEPTSHRMILKMTAKGWVERGSASGRYRITPAGEAALRAQLPVGGRM
ncbi:hypothetical protein [Bradyrhizobium canariense]|uniref:hypothetical protein n=1 Tax=Bradyrhizobium canariense TaxID=255045 RepID=UPI0011BA88FD|nr:hypothetical protein [Bradyrhizobium canariense]